MKKRGYLNYISRYIIKQFTLIVIITKTLCDEATLKKKEKFIKIETLKKKKLEKYK